MNNFRPKLHLEKTFLQKVMNIIGYSIFVGSIVVALFYFPTLPDKVPTHFNISGEVDGWGSKYSLFAIPIIAGLMLIPLEMVEKRPHLHNYPAFLNEKNVAKLYGISVRTMNLTKNGLLMIFGFLLIQSVMAAKYGEAHFGVLLIILIILIVLFPLGWHIVSMMKVKRLHS